MSEKNPVQSAGRIFEILEMLAQNGTMGLMELSQSLALSKSTTHRLLNSLSVMGYVRKESSTGKYQLTFKILEIAGKVLEQVDVLSIAHKYIDQLMKQTHETVHFVQQEGSQIVYIDKVESDANSIRMVSRIGLRMPMYCTGVGKAMLAEMPECKVVQIWEQSKIERFTDKTIVRLDKLLEELETIKKIGYALDNEENEIGVRCIAACVRNYSGKANNAFSISAPISRMSDERIEALSKYVLQTRKELSRELGGREP